MLHLCPLSKWGETLFCTCRTIEPYLFLSVSLETKCCTLNYSWSLWLKLGTLAFFPLQSMWSYWYCKLRGQRPMKNTGLYSEYCLLNILWPLSLSLIHGFFSLMPYIFIFQSYNGGDKVMKSYQFWNKKIRRKYLCLWIVKTVKWLRH